MSLKNEGEISENLQEIKQIKKTDKKDRYVLNHCKIYLRITPAFGEKIKNIFFTWYHR